MKKNYFVKKRRTFSNLFLLGSACILSAFNPAPDRITPPKRVEKFNFFDVDDYVQFTVTGFTEDVVANGVGAASETTTNSVDAANYVFAEYGTQFTEGGSSVTTGLPSDGILTNSSNSDLTFQLADYSENNVLRLQTQDAEGAVTFDETGSYEAIYLAVTSGDGASTISGTIDFEDGTTQEFSSLSVSDWFGGSNPLISGIGRKSRTTTNAFEYNASNPRIYQLTVAVDAANQTKTVTGVTITKDSSGGVFNLFAVTGKLAADCQTPTDITEDAVNAFDATFSWTAYAEGDTFEVAIVEAGAEAPTTGTEVSEESYQFTDLDAETSYDVYVRTVCSVSGYSYWSEANNFTTPIACEAPTEITISAIATTSATVAWTAGAEDQDTFEYVIQEAGAEAPESGEETSTTTFDADELTANTTYDVYVRANCGDTNGYSSWTMVSFVTACDAFASIDEDFEGDDVPDCWSIINDGDANGWILNNGGWPSYPYSGDKSMRISYSSTAHDDYLITPPFTVVDHVSDYINFWARNYSGTWVDEFNVLVSTTGNAKADFTDTLASNVAPSTTYTQYEYDLSAYEGETIYVAIQAISTNEYYLYIDDVKTEGEPYCLVPENIATSDVEAYSATLTWDAGDNTAWEVAYVEAGEDAPESGTSVEESTYEFTELTPETAYTAYLRTDCGENGYSEWVTLDFTTTVSCMVPDEVSISSIETTGATVSWNSSAENQGTYEVAYVESGEDAPESGEEVSETEFSLSELTPGTSYDVYVRANCGETDGYSEWVMISFATACVPVDAIDEDFEGDELPNCWSVINDGDPNGWVLYDNATYAHSGTKSMRITYNYSEAHDDYLITPAFTVVDHVSDYINFWARNYNANYIDEFNVLVSTTGNAKADFTDTLASNVGPGTTYTEYEYDLSAYEGQTIYVAIQAISVNEWYLYIDDFTTLGSDYCSAPTALEADDITPTTATLTWEDEESDSWEIVVQEEGAGEPTEAGIMVEDDEYEATFTAGTVSEFYVRAICADGENYSAWAGPFAFGGYESLEITGGQNFDVIANGVGDASASTTNDIDGGDWAYLSEDFKVTESDDDLTYGLPANGVISSTNTVGLSYEMSDYATNNSLRIETAGTENGGTITVDAEQPAENLYLLVTSGGGSGSISGTINFTDGSSQSIFANTVPDWYNSSSLPVAVSGIGRVNVTDNTLNNPSGNPRIYELEVIIGQVHHQKIIESITLQKDSGDGIVNVFAASIKYSSYAASVEDVRGGATVKVYPNPVQNKLNISGVEASAVEVYNMLGQQVAVSLSNNVVDMTSLNAGVYLVTIHSQNATETVRVIKK